MNLSLVLSILTKAIDIGILWIIFYFILKNVRNNNKMFLIVKGVIIILIIKVISDILNLNAVGVILEYAVEWGPLALIVVFQPEIRSALESIGRTQLLGRHKVLTNNEREKVVNEIMKAVEYLRKNKVGALIAVEREVSLQQYINNSNKIYADVSASLIENIFLPSSPLHDGGIIIQGDRITCSNTIFKTSMSQSVPKRLGTRHRAALGVAEESDAVALVVSEETGKLSIAIDNKLNYGLTYDEVRNILLEELSPKAETFFVSHENESEVDNLD